MWFDRRPVVTLVVAVVLVHAGVLAWARVQHGRVDAYALRSLDSGEYYRLAGNLAAAGAFSQSEARPFEPDTWRTPGYPLLLAACMRLGLQSPAALVVAQQLLGVAAVVLFYHVAAGIFSRRRALLAALLLLVEPYHLFYGMWLLAETLFLTLVLVLWACWQRALRGPPAGWTALAGAAAGALVLVRPIGLAIVPLLLAWWAVRRGPAGGRRAAARAVCVFAAAAGAVAGCWVVRNRVVAGHWALSHQSGIVLAYFKATEAVLWREGRGADRYDETSLDPSRPHRVWDTIDARFAQRLRHLGPDPVQQLRWPNLAQGNRTEVDPFVISNALWGIGLDLLLESPRASAACYAAGCADILTFPLRLGLRLAADPAAADRVRLGHLGLGGLYAGLAVAACVGLVRGRPRLDQVYFPLAVLAALLLASTPQSDPRFRVPLIPLLLLMALIRPRQ